MRVRMREATCADEKYERLRMRGGGVENEGEGQIDAGGEVARVRDAKALDGVRTRVGRVLSFFSSRWN